MDLFTLDGVYEDGKIELDKPPVGVKRARVRVLFLEAETEGKKTLQTRREAAERLLASMRQGLDFGGEKFNRDEIYHERMLELDQRRGG
jgi:hypothetical protein